MPRMTKTQAHQAIQSAMRRHPHSAPPPTQQKVAKMATVIKKREDRSPRLLRCTTVALIFVTFYFRGNMPSSSIDTSYTLSSTTHQNSTTYFYTPNKISYQERLHKLNQLPAESIHRTAFITFSYVKHDDTHKLLDFLLPAVDTWAAPTAYWYNATGMFESEDRTFYQNEDHTLHNSFRLYVVFSQVSKDPFEKMCGSESKQLPPEKQALCKRIHPIYVDCPEGGYGQSPCCKQQKGLLEIFKDDYPLYDWYAFFDDDVYLRKEYIAKVLHVLQPPDFPMAAVAYNQDKRFIAQKGSGSKTCGKEGMDHFMYPWGQPIFYSRGAMSTMARGYRANSLTLQCAAFNLTHDVGNQVLNWMYSLPMAALPPLVSLPIMRKDHFGSHWVGRDDVREDLYGEDKQVTRRVYTASDRVGRYRTYIQKMLPKGEFSFYETHKKWMKPAMKHPKVKDLATVRNETLAWYKNVTGFRQTDTFAVHGDPQTWKEGQWFTMQYTDCVGAERSHAIGMRRQNAK